MAWQVYLPAIMRFVITVHIPELLRDAGANGLHVRDIAIKAGVDEQKLGMTVPFL